MNAPVAILLGGLLAQTIAPPRDARPPASPPVKASLTGRVVDDRGTPVPAATVVAVGGPPPGAHPAITTEDGRYTIADLEPGLYTISVGKPGHPTIAYGQMRRNGPGKPYEISQATRYSLPLTLPRGAVISGSVVDDSGEHAAGYVAITPEPGSWTSGGPSVGRISLDARSEFRAFGLAAGTYRISGRRPGESAQEASGSTESQTITLAAGEERGGVIVRVPPPRPTTYVTAQLEGPDAPTLRYPQISLRRPGEARPISTSSNPNPDGTRTLTGIGAGQYRLVVRAGVWWGGTDFMVDGEHPAAVTVALARGVRVRGVASFDGTEPRGRVTVHLTPADADGLADDNNGATGDVSRDGTFVVDGVPPGRFVMQIFHSDRDPWRLASARLGDADIADVPLTVAHDDIDGVRVVLTTSRTTLKGIATRAEGGPANGITVIAFPIDATLRSVRNSRRVATAQTTIVGEYEIGGLPPGKYGLAIAEDVDREALRDPTFVGKLRAIATVTLAPGESRVQAITVR